MRDNLIDKANRVNDKYNKNESDGLWNKYNKIKSKATKELDALTRSQLSATVDITSIPWLHNSSN